MAQRRGWAWARGAMAMTTLGAIALVSAGGCRGGASSVCSDLCPAYITCSEANGSGAKVPLFCDSDASSTCQSACIESADGLGDSEGRFLDCATCVLKFGADQICDKGKAETVGAVSCKDACTKDGVGAASSKFYDDFTTAFEKGLKSQSCNQTGEKTWRASDPILSHSGGQDNGDGSWSCTKDQGCFGDAMYGPYVALPPGNYTAGFFGVSGTANNPGDMLYVDVNSNSSSTSILAMASFPLAGLPSRLTMSFTLSESVPDLEVRMNGYDGVTIGGVFIDRN